MNLTVRLRLITEDLVKEKYLEYWQVFNTDPAGFEFLNDPQTHAETTRLRSWSFWPKLMGLTQVFTSQYEDALQDEEATESELPDSGVG